MAEVDEVRRALETLPDLQLAYAFGSVVSGRATSASDLDIAVLFADRVDSGRLDRLSEQLSAAAGRSVDLVDLAKASPLLAHQVIASGTCLVSRDARTRADFETRTVMRYLDTRHLRSIQHRYLAERAQAHHDRRA